MNLDLDAFLAGLKFRTGTPDYAEGDTLDAYVTGRDAGGGVRVRIGDTVLRLPDADPALVDALVSIRVTSFDPAAHEGTAELVEVVTRPE